MVKRGRVDGLTLSAWRCAQEMPNRQASINLLKPEAFDVIAVLETVSRNLVTRFCMDVSLIISTGA